MDAAKRWFEWMPGWLPITGSILVAAFVVGQYTQSISDRLTILEKEVKAIQEYIYEHPRSANEPPPISDNMPPQVSGGDSHIHY